MPFRIESRPLFIGSVENGKPCMEMGPWEQVHHYVFTGKEEAEEAMGDLVDIGFDPDRLRVVEVEA